MKALIYFMHVNKESKKFLETLVKVCEAYTEIFGDVSWGLGRVLCLSQLTTK